MLFLLFPNKLVGAQSVRDPDVLYQPHLLFLLLMFLNMLWYIAAGAAQLTL